MGHGGYTLELSLKDSVSAGLKDMGRALSNVRYSINCLTLLSNFHTILSVQMQTLFLAETIHRWALFGYALVQHFFVRLLCI